MGEPAVPTPAERAETLTIARAIVEVVRDDEPMSDVHNLGVLARLPDHIANQLETTLFRLAQDLVDVTEERDRLLAARAEPRTIDEHAFVGDGYDCESCGEGRQHYLHTDREPEYGV